MEQSYHLNEVLRGKNSFLMKSGGVRSVLTSGGVNPCNYLSRGEIKT